MTIGRPIGRNIAQPVARPLPGQSLGVSGLPLDSLSSTVAYGLRKLRTAYSGSAIRVRRSSDNTEQDIGFSGNALDTSSLLSFCGANNGFVVTWYDQSGSGVNLTQSTTTQQPRIVNAGTYDAAGIFDGTDDFLAAGSTVNAASSFTFAAWVYSTNLVGGASIDGRGIAASTVNMGAIGDWSVSVKTDGTVGFSRWSVAGAADLTGQAKSPSGAVVINVWRHIAVTWNGTSRLIYVDGVLQSIVSNDSTFVGWGDQSFVLGRSWTGAGYYWIGRILEAMVFPSALSSTAITTLRSSVTPP